MPPRRRRPREIANNGDDISEPTPDDEQPAMGGTSAAAFSGSEEVSERSGALCRSIATAISHERRPMDSNSELVVHANVAVPSTLRHGWRRNRRSANDYWTLALVVLVQAQLPITLLRHQVNALSRSPGPGGRDNLHCEIARGYCWLHRPGFSSSRYRRHRTEDYLSARPLR